MNYKILNKIIFNSFTTIIIYILIFNIMKFFSYILLCVIYHNVYAIDTTIILKPQTFYINCVNATETTYFMALSNISINSYLYSPKLNFSCIDEDFCYMFYDDFDFDTSEICFKIFNTNQIDYASVDYTIDEYNYILVTIITIILIGVIIIVIIQIIRCCVLLNEHNLNNCAKIYNSLYEKKYTTVYNDKEIELNADYKNIP